MLTIVKFTMDLFVVCHLKCQLSLKMINLQSLFHCRYLQVIVNAFLGFSGLQIIQKDFYSLVWT